MSDTIAQDQSLVELARGHRQRKETATLGRRAEQGRREGAQRSVRELDDCVRNVLQDLDAVFGKTLPAPIHVYCDQLKQSLAATLGTFRDTGLLSRLAEPGLESLTSVRVCDDSEESELCRAQALQMLKTDPNDHNRLTRLVQETLDEPGLRLAWNWVHILLHALLEPPLKPNLDASGLATTLIDALEISGTGQETIGALRLSFKEGRGANAGEVITWLEANKASKGTVQKARALISELGKPLSLTGLAARLNNVAAFAGASIGNPTYRARFIESVPEWEIIEHACRRLLNVTGDVRSQHVTQLARVLRFEALIDGADLMPLPEIVPAIRALFTSTMRSMKDGENNGNTPTPNLKPGPIIQPLPISDRSNWQKLAPAFSAVSAALGKRSLTAKSITLIAALSTLDRALAACGLREVADQWNYAPGDSPASHSRKLLQIARDSKAIQHYLATELSKKDAIFLKDMDRRITQFAAEVIAHSKPTGSPPPLTELELAIFDIIKAQPEGKGITGKAIISQLGKRGFDCEQSTLTRHIIPKLKTWYGVANRPSVGYYLKRA